MMATLDDVTGIVSEIMGVSKADLRGPIRARNVANPRQVCYLIARQKTNRSLPQIARYFGDRDHTTIIKGVLSIQRKAEKDKELAEAIEKAAEAVDTIGRAVFYRHGALNFRTTRTVT